ncbi:MAG: YhfC family intramembrane metalloprotease, partial [Anaerolineae bacterium]|nr:YhfC family intramembrane metalloprotease [Anaerolineae bacterium]
DVYKRQVVYAAARRLSGGYLGLGALAWVITIALKFAWAIPVNKIVYNALYSVLPEMLAGPVFYLYVGALTGVFEVALVWLVLRYTRLGRVDWKRVLGFGIGFGAVEALMLGLSSLGNVATAMIAPSFFPPAALEEFAKLSNALYILAPIVERFFTVLVHVLSNVLLFYAVARRQPRWFWLAFVYKTLIDTVAAYAQITGLTLGKIWAVEAVVAVWGALGWWGTSLIARHYPVSEGGHVGGADIE